MRKAITSHRLGEGEQPKGPKKDSWGFWFSADIEHWRTGVSAKNRKNYETKKQSHGNH